MKVTSEQESKIIREFLKWYRYNHVGIRGLSNTEIIKNYQARKV